MRRLGLGLLLALAALGCGRVGPRAIAYGSELCEHCHMTILEARFAAEAVTGAGRVFVFDDVACLAKWFEGAAEGTRGWVVSFVDGRSWLPADSAVFLRSAAIRTPMASSLAALRPGAEADSVRLALGGELLTWAQVRAGTAAGEHAHPGGP